MPVTFSEQPILNSPYERPTRHWELKDGIPTDHIVEERRHADYITPVPPARRQSAQSRMTLGVAGLSNEEQEYDPNALINEIRRHVDAWRTIPNPRDWGVTDETRRLLQHWRSHNFQGIRPFFCQVEAAEIIIWLTEVAGVLNDGRGRARRDFRTIEQHIRGANEQANPELLRLALKLATGAGKTTVMAMLIAWQTVNAVRQRSPRFTKGFLVVTPGITIRDRLRVLLPNDPENYYEHRDLVPKDMLGAIAQARVVITNYHAFKLRERESIAAGTRRLIQGNSGEELDTLETQGQMLRRVMPELMGLDQVMVLNDEGHHCYREKVGEAQERRLEQEERAEARKNSEAARLWISGVETVKRNIGTLAVIDLSATPFFLRGSGYPEGTLFGWTVCDFSLMDAIESGIVKIPRVPVADNMPGGSPPIFRNLWDNIRGDMPRAGRRSAGGNLDPRDLPSELQSALDALYGHYERTFHQWETADIDTPPVFIVVCNNTATSKLIYDYISGFESPAEEGADPQPFLGRFPLFRNYDDNGNRRPIPRTLLIDSEQLESGDALSGDFRAMASDAIERFRRERVQRTGNQGDAGNISDQDLLREVMNTVGKPGRLGADIHCVVSVSMLTEGSDANTVTHILGVRAFGTQLLCEQVVGRALRRQSYELNEDWHFDVEYADVLGIPFDFTAAPVVAPPRPPAPTVRVHAVSPERDHLEIIFPRVTGYRVELPDERVTARFNSDSLLELTPELVGPSITNNQGIIGEGIELTLEHLEATRRQTIEFELTQRILETLFREPGETPKMHLFRQIQRVVREWLDGGYLKCYGNTYPAQLRYREIGDLAAERIKVAIVDAMRRDEPDGANRIKAIIDPYTLTGSTRFVNFTTSVATYRQPQDFANARRLRWQTDPDKCHVNWAVCDRSWEAELCRVIERHKQTLAYAKNHGLGFEVPYRMGAQPKTYIPDFIIRIDDGQGADDPLNLIAEVKGYRGEDAIAKAAAMRTYWIPGVNNLRSYGRWAFHEFTSVNEMQDEFDEVLDRGSAVAAAQRLADAGGTQPDMEYIPRRR